LVQNSKHKIKCEVWNVLPLFRCDSLQEKDCEGNEIYYCLKVFGRSEFKLGSLDIKDFNFISLNETNLGRCKDDRSAFFILQPR
jgi:hypothetical protein